MPLSETSKKVKKEMEEQYGEEKGESIFYATANKKGGPAEAASTWKKKKKAAAFALAGVLCKVAGHEKEAQGGLWEMIKPYLPYIAAGGLGGLTLGSSDTPWWQRLLGGALMGGLGSYGAKEWLMPWINKQLGGGGEAAPTPPAKATSGPADVKSLDFAPGAQDRAALGPAGMEEMVKAVQPAAPQRPVAPVNTSDFSLRFTPGAPMRFSGGSPNQAATTKTPPTPQVSPSRQVAGVSAQDRGAAAVRQQATQKKSVPERRPTRRGGVGSSVLTQMPMMSAGMNRMIAQ